MTASLVGARLGDFEVVRELGRGGMGVVYEARQVSLNRRVALKVLAAGLGLTARAVERFRREAEAAAKLHHTNIVPVYATGEHDGTHFYAMELIDGPSLDRVLAQLRAAPPADAPALAATTPYATAAPLLVPADAPALSGPGYFDAVARLLAGVADALQYAHDHGVIHRDVKPANILVSPDGRLSLNDFGLARMLEQPGMTMTGEFVGTPVYMSPEQIAAGRIPIDGRTDIYSLGATLYEMLTGHPPFRGERRDQLLAQVLHADPAPPRAVNAKVPRDLETICLKALEKDPARRYRTAAAMADDLRRFVNRFAILARRAGPVERLRKWARRHKALSAALACAALAVLVAGAFAYQAHLAERKLRDERRQAATDHAMLLAIGGDLDRADEATDKAEQLGASPARVNMLRGLVLNHKGDYAGAVRHLRQAAALEPDNVSARALLLSAFVWAGLWEEFEAGIEGLEGLEPGSPEDGVFLALAQSYLDPRRGLAALERATAKQTTPLARVVGAQVRADCAMETDDPALADRAVRDAVASKEAMPPTCGTRNISAFAHLVALTLTTDRHSPRYRELLAAAAADTEALQRQCGHLPESVRLRWAYLDHIGDLAGARELLIAAPAKAEEMGLLAGYALAKFSLSEKDGQEALAVVERRGNRGAWLDFVRAILIADRPGTGLADGLTAYQGLQRVYRGGNRPLAHAIILDLLGRHEQSAAFSREALKHPERLRGPDRAFTIQSLTYCCGPPEKHGDFLAAAGRSRRRLTEAHCTIAVAYLGRGDRVRAMQHFRKSLLAGQFYSADYLLSRVFLTRLEKDLGWPKKWVAAKK